MKNIGRSIGTYIIIFAVVLSMSMMIRGMAGNADVKEVKFSQFATHLEKGDFETINITDRKLTGVKKDGTSEVTYAPSLLEISWLEEKTINKMLEENKIELESEPPKSEYTLLNILPTLLMVVAMGFLFYFMMSQGGNKQAFQFGKNRAKLYKSDAKAITFKDVAGLEEEKVELSEIVDFLRNPGKYTKLGARIPKGVLLVGSPGTGKTYISRATAGEAGVPFFTISGSDFVEMFVGVGASRVRDLFKQAQQHAPCIVFIDEIDAIGKSRDAQYGGGNDEREQTLNQLLSEMDGFDTSKGVVIIAATNRPEVLDKALLRPGRFDRRIIVDKPDLKGRVEILKVHAKNVLLDDSVNLEEIGLATSGAVGSDLANIINEAAILAVKRNRTLVTQDDLMESVEVVIAGKEKKDRILSEKEKKIVAYHETGHALITALEKNAEPVQKITIVPRTMGSLGYVMQVPEEEKYLMSEEELKARLVTLFGGRAAEELVFGSITTGASNDIEKATDIARAMITQYGMSKKFGLIGLEKQGNQYLDGRSVLNCGDQTAAEIDHEVMELLKECYDKAKELLSGNRDIMDRIAEYLSEKETITGKQFMEIYNEVIAARNGGTAGDSNQEAEDEQPDPESAEE